MRTKAVIYILVVLLIIAGVALVHRRYSVVGADGSPYLRLNRYTGQTCILVNDNRTGKWYWEAILDCKPVK